MLHISIWPLNVPMMTLPFLYQNMLSEFFSDYLALEVHLVSQISYVHHEASFFWGALTLTNNIEWQLLCSIIKCYLFFFILISSFTTPILKYQIIETPFNKYDMPTFVGRTYNPCTLRVMLTFLGFSLVLMCACALLK